ncbi:RNA polymerase II-associated protein 3-like [Homarus americanus]|uniref:RNA polymerase II-associated protein 3-like n=1 Tax=Homarus americanus TaxID=6706 RepID=UPI001C45CDB3|nr:RNA polymerase II-associated protein 3-like [Homarus americanus]
MEKTSSLVLQKNIKDNCDDLQDFLKDLNKWEKEIRAEDEKLCDSSKEGNTNTEIGLPIRCKKKLETSSGKGTPRNSSGDSKRRKNEGENVKKKDRIPAHDYAAWEKFDVDKALASSSSEEEQEMETPLKSKDSDIKGPKSSKKERALAMKEAGNKLYGSGKLDDAIAKYTQGMALDPTNAVLPANRAMAYIKLNKYTAAEADCNRSLKLEAGYIKAYLRRATCRIKLGKSELAIKDYQKVLQLESWNKEAKKELEKLEGKQSIKDEKTGAPIKLVTKAVSNQENANSISTVETKILPCEKSSQLGEPKKQEKDSASHQKQNGNNVCDNPLSKAKKEQCGKKLKIVEVNSQQDLSANPVDPNCILPVEKPPHLRSTKPLKRIPVVDVLTQEDIQKLPVSSVSNQKTSPKKHTHIKNTTPKLTTGATTTPTKIEENQKMSTALPSLPKTSHQFTQDWNSLSRQTLQAVKYLKMIQPAFFSTVDIEADTVISVMSVLNSEEVSPTLAANYLIALSKSNGFSVNIMFFDDTQRKVLNEVILKCEKEESCSSEVKNLKNLLNRGS